LSVELLPPGSTVPGVIHDPVKTMIKVGVA
jgi:hypothetical protein